MESVVTVCRGRRCRAVTSPAPEGEDQLAALRAAVRVSRDAVLVSAACVGPCAQAPVVVLSDRGLVADRVDLAGSRWLGPVTSAQLPRLCDWIVGGQERALPDELAGMVFASLPRGD